jgi:hypothetical protein
MTNLVTTNTQGQEAVGAIVEAIKGVSVFAPGDIQFLEEKREHLAAVLERTHIWRTDTQKRSIVSDGYHPTPHSKFHQAMLEQKVQFEQTLYLAKDFESKKLEIEEIECELEELESSDLSEKRKDIKKRKLLLDLNFKQFELKQMQISMHYRMDEVKGWQTIEEDLLKTMREVEKLPEDLIWSKDRGELVSFFFVSMTNLQGLQTSSDGAERNNLVNLARFTYGEVLRRGILDQLKPMLNPEQAASAKFIEETFFKGA